MAALSPARLLTVIVIAACAPVNVDRVGRPCNKRGQCAPSWICHPEQGVCAPEITVGCTGVEDVCPSAVSSGDSCDYEDAFVPCRGGSADCQQGCRTCADGVWSDCTEAKPCDPGETIDRPCYDYGLGLDDRTLGVGACATGTQVCADMDGDGVFAWGDCVGDRVPQAEETCVDGVDDDCNGVADDGCACDTGSEAPCYEGAIGTEDVGVCHGGTKNCVDGQWGACVGQVKPAAVESCNGEDDDCDDAVDEDLPAATPDPCGSVGVCADGTPTCAGVEGWKCAYPSMWQAVEDLCDGFDNDCDDQTDEDPVAPAGTCPDVGVCSGASSVCNGAAGWACDDPAWEAVESICDGLDNDCDGETDEEIPLSACPACLDRLDNDYDTGVDYPDDPGCSSPTDDDETNLIEESCSGDTELPVPSTGIVTGTTVGAGDNYQSTSCGGSGPDVVYEVPLPAGAVGILGATDYPGTNYDSVMYVRDGCDDQSSERVCSNDEGLGDDALLLTAALNPGTYFVFIDGYSGSDGSYEASIEVLVGEGRACHPDDGYYRCAPGLDCEAPAGGGDEVCVPSDCDPIANNPGSFAVTGTTVGQSNNHVGSCGGGGWRAPEAVYVLSLASAVSRVRLDTSDNTTDFDTVVYVREGCDGAEIDCDDDGGSGDNSSLDLGALGPGDYYIFVDGFAYERGTFRLSVTVDP